MKTTYLTMWNAFIELQNQPHSRNIQKLAIPRMDCRLDKWDCRTIRNLLLLLLLLPLGRSSHQRAVSSFRHNFLKQHQDGPVFLDETTLRISCNYATGYDNSSKLDEEFVIQKQANLRWIPDSLSFFEWRIQTIPEIIVHFKNQSTGARTKLSL